MPCYSPIIAWQLKTSATAKSRIFFKYVPHTQEIKIPCGKCIGCRLERARQWAVRCVCESKLHADNLFITLTYDENHVPKNMSLLPRDLTLFWKRLRKKYPDKKIKYLACGEYGERTKRPHYHAIVFGLTFKDIELITVNRNGYPEVFRNSETLSDLWGLGHVSIGDVTFESASYVARYCTKKILGNPELAAKHYNGRIPEFLHCSHGIAKNWYENKKTEIYPLDQVMSRNRPAPVPRYFDKLLEKDNPELLAEIKERRKLRAKEETPARLVDKEELVRYRLKKRDTQL